MSVWYMPHSRGTRTRAHSTTARTTLDCHPRDSGRSRSPPFLKRPAISQKYEADGRPLTARFAGRTALRFADGGRARGCGFPLAVPFRFHVEAQVHGPDEQVGDEGHRQHADHYVQGERIQVGAGAAGAGLVVGDGVYDEGTGDPGGRPRRQQPPVGGVQPSGCPPSAGRRTTNAPTIIATR